MSVVGLVGHWSRNPTSRADDFADAPFRGGDRDRLDRLGLQGNIGAAAGTEPHNPEL